MADNFKHKNTDLTLINDSGDLDLIRQYTEAYNKAYLAVGCADRLVRQNGRRGVQVKNAISDDTLRAKAHAEHSKPHEYRRTPDQIGGNRQ